jgi:hypothetical protein
MEYKNYMQSDFINETNVFIKTFVNQIPIDIVNENKESSPIVVSNSNPVVLSQQSILLDIDIGNNHIEQVLIHSDTDPSVRIK